MALASYTAAGLAGSDPMQTGWQGLKLTLAGFIVPFIFVYNPIMLMQGFNLVDGILVIISALLGVFSLAIAVQNYYSRKLIIIERLAFFAGALLLIKPGIYTDLAGLTILTLTFLFHVISTRSKNNKVPEVI